jgi:hypothetical protein
MFIRTSHKNIGSDMEPVTYELIHEPARTDGAVKLPPFCTSRPETKAVPDALILALPFTFKAFTEAVPE